MSPLFVPDTRVTISGVPLFIPNDLLARELASFGKFATRFKTVRLGCKDSKLRCVQSLRRQAFMCLSDPSRILEVSFKVNFENGFYTVYASAGSMKCFVKIKYRDVSHKSSFCPHREPRAGSSSGETFCASHGAPKSSILKHKWRQEQR